MRTASSTLGLLFLNIFIESTTASCGHGTSLLRRKVNISKRQEGAEPAKTVEVGQFGYIGTQGPTGWAGLAPENGACATSTQQSPIDVTNTSTTLVAPGALVMNFPAVASAEFENIGTTIEVVMEGKGASTTVDGKAFELKQFHFHSPSEHTVDGEYFPLEMHMVHEAADGAIAVIAAQFQLTENGETTSLLTSVTEKIGAITAPGSVTETGPLDFAPLVTTLSAQSLHTYSGSLTTPPCAEGLTFFITSQQLPLNVATFNQIKAVVGFNSRFTQNTAGQENLLSLASKQVLAAAPAAGEEAVATPVAGEEAVATPSPVAGEEAVATPVAGEEALATASPVAGEEAVASPPPAVPDAGEASPPAGGAQVISPGGGVLDSGTADLIKSLTGIDVGRLKH